MKTAIIVGAGISAATICAVLKRYYKIRVFEIRDHIGGNCYDYQSRGTYIHKYGAHIYHNPDPDLHLWICQFTSFKPYRHYVYAYINQHQAVPFPYSEETEQLLQRSLSDEEIIETFFKPYSEKMWGCKWEELPDSIRNRVPKRLQKSDFFPNQFVGLPDRGYTWMMENMFDGADILLSVPQYAWVPYAKEADLIFYCGRLDTLKTPENIYFGAHSHGSLSDLWLKYVTLEFEWHCGYKKESIPSGVVNYCYRENPFIRTVYHAKITGGDSEVYHSERPVHFVFPNDPSPFYPHYSPIMKQKHQILKEMAKHYYPNLIPVGRLAEYTYIDMYKAIENAKKIAEKFIP